MTLPLMGACHYCHTGQRQEVRRCNHQPHRGCGWTNPYSRRRVHVCINHAYAMHLHCGDDEA